MMAFEPLSEAVLLHARQAFVLVLTEHGISVPMSEIIAETFIRGNNGDDKHVQVRWQGQSLLPNASGRFYPKSGGGTIHLDFLRFTGGTTELLHEYTFMTKDDCLQLTVAP